MCDNKNHGKCKECPEGYSLLIVVVLNGMFEGL